ncbi:MAG: hypothetical protein D6731_07545 [Planctomycetota bacterium]|nr:MAG: hypothetical protein D6731_07545 [Planctomycetota bacterium]
MSGKVHLHYRHEDGRLIEIVGGGAKAEVWLLYPQRELIARKESLEEAKESLPEGFALDESVFAPPCPKCNEPAPMSPASGMFECTDCDAEF